MSTREVMVFSKNEKDFIKNLHQCNLKEKIVLTLIKDVTKNYISEHDSFEINKFKVSFESKIKSFLKFQIFVDEKTFLINNNKYVLHFYFFDEDVKKMIQLAFEK